MQCRRCPRLSGFRRELRQRYPAYHNNPVDSFGPGDAGLLIVGLAPGLHGANRSGRPFTGDASGQLLFDSLHRAGLASQGESLAITDGMHLDDCRITNAVRCVPPQNKPTPDELNTCNRYLRDEVKAARVILALGGDALKAVALALGLARKAFAFVHGAEYETPHRGMLLVSYHPSRRNLNTGKLTSDMFDRVLARAIELLR